MINSIIKILSGVNSVKIFHKASTSWQRSFYHLKGIAAINVDAYHIIIDVSVKNITHPADKCIATVLIVHIADAVYWRILFIIIHREINLFSQRSRCIHFMHNNIDSRLFVDDSSMAQNALSQSDDVRSHIFFNILQNALLFVIVNSYYIMIEFFFLKFTSSDFQK